MRFYVSRLSVISWGDGMDGSEALQHTEELKAQVNGLCCQLHRR
jgi:hypothetical protein